LTSIRSNALNSGSPHAPEETHASLHLATVTDKTRAQDQRKVRVLVGWETIGSRAYERVLPGTTRPERYQ
jgi:hypothetical protein